jgi:hypothetical protein
LLFKDSHPFGDPIISFEETVVIRDDGKKKELREFDRYGKRGNLDVT